MWKRFYTKSSQSKILFKEMLYKSKNNTEKAKQRVIRWKEKHPTKKKYQKRNKNYDEYDKNYKKIYRERIKNNPIEILKSKARNSANFKIKDLGICEICQINNAKERHHPDYSKPLNIIKVCIKCHKNLHYCKGGETNAKK